ncbi:MAG: hypothetical protein WC127_08255, partial [Acidaminococcaceae bacterium]
MNSYQAGDIEQICIVVNSGLGSKVLKKAKHYGISGGTLLRGKGTVHNRILELLCLSDVKKEIVLMVADRKIGRQVLDKLNEEFKFAQPNQGIAFTTSVYSLIGTRSCKSAE